MEQCPYCLRTRLADLEAKLAKREAQLIEAVTGAIWFDGLSDEVAISTGDSIRRVEIEGVISDAGLLAAIDAATGGE